MTSSSTAPEAGAVQAGESVPAILSPDMVTAYESMIATVPDAGGEGMDGILEMIAAAGDITELDAPWRAQGLQAYLNTPLVVLSIKKLASDYDAGLPWFLVVQAAVTATGERITFTTGAVSVVAQLVKAWSLGKLPLGVIPREASRPTKSGYFPQHLEIDPRQPAPGA